MVLPSLLLASVSVICSFVRGKSEVCFVHLGVLHLILCGEILVHVRVHRGPQIIWVWRSFLEAKVTVFLAAGRCTLLSVGWLCVQYTVSPDSCFSVAQSATFDCSFPWLFSETRSELLLCWSGHRNISDWYCSIHSSEDSFTFSEALHLFCFERHPCFWARACLSSKIKVFSVVVVTGHHLCQLVDFLWLWHNHILFSGLQFSAIVVGWSLLSSLRLVSFGPPLSPLLCGINFELLFHLLVVYYSV